MVEELKTRVEKLRAQIDELKVMREDLENRLARIEKVIEERHGKDMGSSKGC